MKKVLFLIIISLIAGYVYSLDPSVGVCTRKDEFDAKQTKDDTLVQQFIAEKSAAKRKTMLKQFKDLADKDIENLIRYRQPELAPAYVEILSNPKWFIRTRALYALKMAGGANEIPAVIKLLSDKEPMVREAAANCLSNIGDDTAVKALDKQYTSESDPYVKMSLKAALDVLGAPEKPYAQYKGGTKYSEKLTGPEGAKRVEWIWRMTGAPLFNDYTCAACELPEAKEWRYPISLYKSDLFASYPRNSFAAGGTHAAEDCAWFREGCSYYAIADGIVRMVQGAGGDWGFLIVLEHRLPDGSYIVSLYGHCAWDILVRAGDMVKSGQKIATQGLSCSIENGGYGSHIHFGIGDGPFRRSKKYFKGDAIELQVRPEDSLSKGDDNGAKVSGTIVRFGYSKDKNNSNGWPMVTAIIKGKDGKEVEMPLPAETIQDEISWLQAYVAECKGWLNPETFLPEHVEPTKPNPKKK
ncbi:MAG: HEAT repeat domain-containing protein [Planctomycetota bacterium]